MPSCRRLLTILALAAVAGGAAGEDVEFSGFVVANWAYNTADLNGAFGVDEVELNMVHRAGRRAIVRADLEWLKDGEDHVAQVEQAFLRYTTRGGWTFTFGKFNAPFGFEENDRPDLYQSSFSLVSEHGLPGNLTGFSLGHDLGLGFEVTIFGCNGWDRDTKIHGAMSWAGRLAYAREGFDWGVTAISGKEEELPADGGPRPYPTFTRTVFDLDVSFATARWLFGGELNRGEVVRQDGGKQLWSGFLLLARHEFDDRAGLTVRYDFFHDRDGYAFAPIAGRFQRRQSLAVAPTYELAPGLDVIVELRVDWSNREAFRDREDRPTDRSTTVIVQALQRF